MQTLESPEVSVPPDGSGRSGRFRTLRAVALSVAIMWVLSSIALLIYTAGTRGATDRELIIPPGTRDQIAAGFNPLDIPQEWDFIAGDTLVLRNEDTVHHWIGLWFVDAGATTVVELQPVYAGVLVCSVHPSGQIDIRVEPGGYDWKLPIFPAVLLGVPLGLVGSGVRRVMAALRREEDDAES